jgi:hypothetical protein
MTGRLFDPKLIIPAFDRYIEARELTFSAVAVGGAALSVLGIITRSTLDVDLLDAVIPTEIMRAAKEFAVTQTISESWLNNGPSSLTRDLPGDWRERIRILYEGKALNLWTLDRIDLIRTKLWAMCDRIRDLGDLIDMAPSDAEISVAAEWVKQLDTNPNWPDHVDTMVAALRQRLGRA